MEELRKREIIEDYSLTQTTLDEVRLEIFFFLYSLLCLRSSSDSPVNRLDFKWMNQNLKPSSRRFLKNLNPAVPKQCELLTL